jgi:hypothetical protein
LGPDHPPRCPAASIFNDVPRQNKAVGPLFFAHQGSAAVRASKGPDERDALYQNASTIDEKQCIAPRMPAIASVAVPLKKSFVTLRRKGASEKA